MSLVSAITNSAGQPLTSRVGIVISVAPFQVDLQGTTIEGPNLGIVGAVPSLGDNVLLLGQAVKGASTSGSSWVCLGTITPA